MAQRNPIKRWEDIEKDSPEQQRLYLKGKLLGRESINRYTDIKLGDHLVTKGGRNSIRSMISYYHHFRCIGLDEDGPVIVHYYDSKFKRSRSKVSSTSSFGSGSSLWMKGQIQEEILRNCIKEEELQAKENEVQRVVWPRELRRFPTEEVVRRARKRIGEKCYDLIENNCESFVMWCLCDLNISLQVTPGRKPSCEVGRTALLKTLSQIPKMAVDVADDVLRAVCRMLMRNNAPVPEVLRGTTIGSFGDVFGIVSILVYETVCCGTEVWAKYKDWKGPKALIKSKEDFYTKLADRVLLALFRSGASIAGMFAGQLVSICCLCGLVDVVLGGGSSLLLNFCSSLGGFVGAIVGAVSGELIQAKIFSITNAMALFLS